MCLLKSAYALLEHSNPSPYFLCLHLKQIAPPKITASQKASPPLGAYRKSTECHIEEMQEKADTLSGR